MSGFAIKTAFMAALQGLAVLASGPALAASDLFIGVCEVEDAEADGLRLARFFTPSDSPLRAVVARDDSCLDAIVLLLGIGLEPAPEGMFLFNPHGGDALGTGRVIPFRAGFQAAARRL